MKVVLPDLHVKVSDDPSVRIGQAGAFWRRNPGYHPINGFWDAARGAAERVGDKLPVAKQAVDLLAPTAQGYGQPLVDQMQWQINTRRQPDNEWWMKMNARLVGDGLTAEAYLRAGREGEIAGNRSYDAWLDYIKLSDKVRSRLHLEPGADGLAQAGKGASLTDKLVARYWYMPQARRAYWAAHDATIQDAKHESRDLLVQIAKDWPKEAEFSSAWARSVSIYKYLNPPTANRLALPVQKYLLPGRQPNDHETTTAPQRAFARLLEAADSSWEKEIEPRLAAGAATQPSSPSAPS